MAHNLSFQKNTAGDFLSFNEKPWHGFGTILTEQPTLTDALQFGGLDFTVEKLPNIHKIGDIEIPSERSFFTYRTDKNIVLGPNVGTQYTCLQNIEALSIVDTFDYHIETAGVLKDGAISFVCMKSDRQIVVKGSDLTEMYLLFINSFDGSMPVTVLFTPIRVVCNNTLSAALRGSTNKYTIRHTRNVGEKLNETAKVLGILEKNVSVMTDVFNIMADTQINPVDFMGHVFLTKDEIEALALGATLDEDSVLSTRKANIIRNTLSYYESGFGQADFKGTAWGAYNAITGALSHKEFDSPEDFMLSTVLGSNYNTLQEKALTFAQNPKLITPIDGLEHELYN